MESLLLKYFPKSSVLLSGSHHDPPSGHLISDSMDSLLLGCEHSMKLQLCVEINNRAGIPPVGGKVPPDRGFYKY